MSASDKGTASLWDQLQEIQLRQMEELREERKKLEAEKKTMNDVAVDTSDIIEINAGGEAIIYTHRQTLCLVPDSLFSHLFSGRWDDSCARDSQGRIFLDHDPELVRLIVNFLRIKRIDDPSCPILSPEVPQGKKKEFMRLLDYFGLKSFFYPPTATPKDVFLLPGSYRISGRTIDDLGRFTYKCEGSISLMSDGTFSGAATEAIEGRTTVMSSVIKDGKLSRNGAKYTLRYGSEDYSYFLTPPTRQQDEKSCSFSQGRWTYSKIDSYTNNSEQRNKHQGKVVHMLWERVSD